MRTLFSFIIAGLIVSVMMIPANAEEFIVGGDVSSLRAVVDNGGVFYDSTESEGLMQILQEHGFNWMRLKLWHTPDEPYNDVPRVLQSAQEAKALGLKYLLDFHYSDWWADPDDQEKPAAWAALDFATLVDSVYQYTYDVISTLRSKGATPNMVQIGNEIDTGMLFPDGSYADWSKFGQLLNAGASAVRAFEAVGDTIEIMIHHSRGHASFYRNIIAQDVDFDYIGRSYYPSWHGSLDDLESNLNALSNEFGRGIVLAETAYIWTTEWKPGDDTTNVFWTDDVVDGYPATPAGQRNMLLEIRKIVQNVNGGRGMGVFYWEPGWISAPTLGTPWENACLFDFDGNALVGIDALATDVSDIPTSQVTLRINSSTVWDTLSSEGIIQLRGEITGVAGSYLSDGSKIAWDETCDLIAQNVGGDYWELTFPMYVGDILSYKYWTAFAFGSPTAQRVGYEGPVVPGDGSSYNTRVYVAAENDTVLALEYINGSGSTVEQYWRPYELYEDSVAIGYRVNVAHLMLAGEFDPDNGDQVGVVGSVPLFQDQPSLLENEEYSVGGGSFWSGASRIATGDLAGGFNHSYKFALIRGGEVVAVEDTLRYLSLDATFSDQDTTLHWVFFGEYNRTSAPEDAGSTIPKAFSIGSTYPNPFNSDVVINYDLRQSGETHLEVYNLLGREVMTLERGTVAAGSHRIVWDGRDSRGNTLPTGIYLVRLKTESGVDVRKITLVR